MTKVRPFLKWAGGKFALSEQINQLLPAGDTLVEPFVGAGAVFLNNHDFTRYQLNDINPDLINLYKHLQKKPEVLVKKTAKLFTDKHNNSESYYQLRDKFNQARNGIDKSAIFIYLNRHGYNGLCRYNRSGGFNVPFGRYKKPYFPEREMYFFAEKSQRATFTCKDFKSVIRTAKANSVIYCDPPYAHLNPEKANSFTGYAGNKFEQKEQADLADLAIKSSAKSIPVLISNHDTQLTREIYAKAESSYIQVRRYISREANNRKPVQEVFALFK
ncbi:Dam family site-specific DNA-(adenine-N6)-methyltransferase [Catenovulum sp. SM1970]|uniref:Dam family site-specific DNA-(adenine-N6)-methyltransferase n=1 Tax=Marinifaba aquimaris TaxID=2741323 RepID=UPI00157183E9|nr:Dam family site-specific DNA-(adenine-N6)-methyltransferase [Marinifaba aquimaris]NTS78688.1 Dam family site-specific DNA-(adenine-N6)-methyltransferase [Marinifaba aquimaris]